MLTALLETSTLGFDITFKAASNVQELRNNGLSDERIADIVNNNVSNHGQLTKVRAIVLPIVEGYTKVTRIGKTIDGKFIATEKAEPFVERAKATLSSEQLNELNKLVLAAIEDKGLGTLQYLAAARKAGASLTKGLSAFVKQASNLFEVDLGKYTKAYVSKNVGPASDLDEETEEGETPEHIIKMAKFIKAKVEEKQRAMVASVLED